MILRQFLTLTHNASVERRAEAAGALTRAYLCLLYTSPSPRDS